MTVDSVRELPLRAAMTAILACFLAYVDSWLFNAGLVPIAGTYIFLAALVGWAGLVAVQCIVSAGKLREVIALYANHAGVIAALLAIVFCSVVFALLPTAYWADGPMYLLYPPYDVTVVLLSMLLALNGTHRRFMTSYLLAALLVLTGSVMYDAWHPGTFSVVPDRAAGFGMNPNITAFVLVLLSVSILDFTRRRARDGLVLIVTGVGVFLTLSRGGAILFLFEFACYGVAVVRLNARRHPIRVLRSAGALTALLLVLVAAGVWLVERADMFSLTYQRIGMLSGNSGALTDDDGRIEAVQVAWQHVMQSPVIGYGTGYSYSLPLEPHNMYLQQWLNNGFPGLLAYLWLLGIAGRTFWRRRYPRGLLFIGVVAINGLFSHNILEERAFLCLLGILLTSSLYERHPWIAAPAPQPSISK